jgi:hypothetical protein
MTHVGGRMARSYPAPSADKRRLLARAGGSRDDWVNGTLDVANWSEPWFVVVPDE